MTICVLIPGYNVEPTIADVVRVSRRHTAEVIVVDDGSRDGTDDAARAAGASVIRHARNLGKGAALRTGFDYVLRGMYDAVVTVDGDGQHNPADIPKLILAAETGKYDIVIGARMEDTQSMPRIRRWTNWATSRIVSGLSGQAVTDSQSGFRLIRVGVLKRVRLRTTRYDIEPELLIQAARRGFRIGETPVQTIYRTERSHINPLWDTLRFLKLAARSWLFRRPRG